MHPLNVTPLVLGLLLLGVSGIWYADHVGWVSDSDYLFPLLLVIVGLVGLLAFALRGVTGRRADRDDSTASDTDTDIQSDTDTDDEEILR